ncbi:hypothetical protein AWENTII_005126 [Aspergillus wentii]
MYTHILEYQMSLAKSFSRSKFVQFLRDLAPVDDWKDMVGKIQDLDGTIFKQLECLSQSATLQVKETVDEIHSQVDNIKEDTKFIKNSELLEKLHAVQNSAFDSGDQGNIECLPGTQVDMLSRIQDWIDNPYAPPIFWMHGMAGTGKSTIARTVASKLHKMEHLVDKESPNDAYLGANFFFKRTDNQRNNPKAFFPTLASNLAESLPDLVEPICNAIRRNNDIASEHLRNQWGELIRQPLRDLEERFFSHPTIVIVVDALDECEAIDEFGNLNVKIILNLFGQLKNIKSLRMRVLITSRSTNEIQSRFGKLTSDEKENETLQKISLSNSDNSPTDLHLYFQHEMGSIRDYHEREDTWPGNQAIEKLVLKADGLFIFAATICRWFYNPKINVSDRMQTILENDIVGPQETLDKLYIEILEAEVTEGMTEAEKKKQLSLFHDVVGSIMIMFDSVPISVLARLILLEEHKEEDMLYAIRKLLDCLGPVLAVPENSDHSVELLHLSFRDFLVDQERSGDDFWIDEKKAHGNVFKWCLHIMDSTLKRDLCHLRKVNTRYSQVGADRLDEYLPDHVKYACCYWVSHLQESYIVACDGGTIHTFLKAHFTHWVEAMCLMGKAPAGILILNDLLAYISTLLEEKSTDLHAFVEDGKRFITTFRSTIEEFPLQLYTSALLFTPRRSIVRHYFEEEIPRWIQTCLGVTENWDSLSQTLQGHTDIVSSVKFSPDNKSVASASHDETIRLWDVSTWRCLQVLRGHQDEVNDVSFSSDGRTLASASRDTTVRLWDLATGESNIYQGFSEMEKVIFSPDDKKLAAISDYYEVYLWTLDTADPWTLTKTYDVNCYDVMAFSPDSKFLACGDDEHVYLWDTIEGNFSHTVNCPQPKNFMFTTDGETVMFESRSGSLKLWNWDRGIYKTFVSGRDDYEEDGFPCAFSPDRSSVAIISESEGQVHIWEIPTGKKMATLEGIYFTASRYWNVEWLSKGDQVAVIGDEGSIYIWDVATKTLVKELSTGYLFSSVTFSNDGKSMISCGRMRGEECNVWDLAIEVPKEANVLHQTKVNCIAICSDGKSFVSATQNDHVLRVWEASSGALLRILKLPFDPSASYPRLAFSTDAKRLLFRDQNGPMTVWDVSTWEPLQQLNCTLYRIEHAAISPNGMTVVAAADYGVQVWDLQAGGSWTIQSIGSPVRSLVFSPVESLVAVASFVSINIYDTQTVKLIHRLTCDFIPNCLAFSQDASHIAAAGESITLWETGSGTKVWEPGHKVGHDKKIEDIAISEDGKYLHARRKDGIITYSVHDSGQKVNPVTSHNVDWVKYGDREIILIPPEYRAKQIWDPSQDGILAIYNKSGETWPEQILALTTDVVSAGVPDGRDPEREKRVDSYSNLKNCLQSLPTVLGLFNSAEDRRVQQQMVDNLKAAASPRLPNDGFTGVVDSLNKAATTLKKLARSDDSSSVNSIIQELSNLAASLAVDENSDLVAVVDNVAMEWAGQVNNLQQEVSYRCKCDPGVSG